MELREAITQHIEALKVNGRRREAEQLQLEINVLGPYATARALKAAYEAALSGVAA